MNKSRPLFILSPCGTSLLTNTAEQEERALVFRYSNASLIDTIPPEHKKILERIVQRAENTLLSAGMETAAKLSAELNGIIHIYNHRMPANPGRNFHQLLCTDTWLGEQTARLVKMWLTTKGFTADIRKQKDLQTAELASFQLALSDIVSWMQSDMEKWKETHRVIFNLTGGFKSVQGFLQTLAMFYADEAVYIFETGNTLMRIPRLPVEMKAPDVMKNHFDFFRKLHIGMGNLIPPSDIPESMLIIMDDGICLSPWGELIWEQNRHKLYSMRVYPPPCDFVRPGARFMDSVKMLSSDRRRHINEKIDDLCLFWLHRNNGKPYNPVSLDFKELKGNPAPPSTHECDAWAEHGGKRIFMHIESGTNGNKVLVLDRLGDHLK